jgi:hypothetical protein
MGASMSATHDETLTIALRTATNNLKDCAAGFAEQSEWHGALYQAIGKFVSQGGDDLSDLSFSDCDTVKQLAAIGAYLADNGHSAAETFRKKAEK